jgi:hypothetical protein
VRDEVPGRRRDPPQWQIGGSTDFIPGRTNLKERRLAASPDWIASCMTNPSRRDQRNGIRMKAAKQRWVRTATGLGYAV